MKKILFIIFMFAFMNVTYAEECTEEKLKELKQIADNIVIDTEFDDRYIETQMYSFNLITIQGLKEDFYIYSKDMSILYEYKDNIDGKIEDTITSDIEELYVYSDICPNEVIRKIKLSLKTYNPYSQYEECEGISGDELDVCDRYYDKILSEDEFIEKINEYKNNNKTGTKETNKGNKTIYLIIIGSVVVISLVIALIVRRKRNILD